MIEVGTDLDSYRPRPTCLCLGILTCVWGRHLPDLNGNVNAQCERGVHQCLYIMCSGTNVKCARVLTPISLNSGKPHTMTTCTWPGLSDISDTLCTSVR